MAEETDGTDQAQFEEDKHRSFWLSVSDLVPTIVKEHHKLISTQLNYPISEWANIIEFANETLMQKKLDHTLLAHAGSGVCLINILSNGNDKAANAVNAVQKLLDQCHGSGGNLVVQRAPSEMKKDLPIWGKQGTDMMLMKRIKAELDPIGIMSPGRFIDGS